MSNSSVNPYSNLNLGIAWQNLMILGVATPTSPATVNTNIIGNNTIPNSIVATYYPISGGGVNTQTPTLADTLTFMTANLQVAVAESQNDYINGVLHSGQAGFSQQQMVFINDLLQGIRNVTVNSIGNIGANIGFIDTIQDRIAQSDLSAEEKTPLFMACTIGDQAFTYWSTVYQTVGGPWLPFLDINAANDVRNWFNIPRYIIAAIEGCLLGYINSQLMDQPRTLSNQIISMLACSAAVNACMVIFRWVPNGINPVSCC